jgi:uncharacterized protein (TIGR03435 family)
MKLWLVCGSLLLCGAAYAQPSEKLAFQVVSIKPAEPMPMNQVRMNRSSDPGRVRLTGFALKDLIRLAYRVKDFQVEGTERIDNARFDVEGKFPAGVTEDKVPEMLQAMLAERFKLTIHRDTKEHGIFALVPGKGGPKLKAADLGEGPPPGANPGRGGLPAGAMRVQVDDQGAHVKASGVTLSQLAEMISRFSERPVVDMTKIEGMYEFDLVLSPDSLRGAGHPAAGASGPSEAASEGPGTVHEAVQRYGLKLAPRKAPMEMIVVDHIEKTPTEN